MDPSFVVQNVAGIGSYFGVGQTTPYNWKQRGAPIAKPPFDLIAIASWYWTDRERRSAEIRKRKVAEICERRMDAGLLRPAIAKRAGLPPRTVANCEGKGLADGRLPSAETIDKVASALDELIAECPIWLDVDEAAELIGICSATIRNAIRRSLEYYEHPDFDDGEELRVCLCNCIVRMLFANDGRWRLAAEDLGPVVAAHETLRSYLEDGRFVGGRWTDRRREQWITTGQAQDDEEIGFGRALLNDALAKELGVPTRGVRRPKPSRNAKGRIRRPNRRRKPAFRAPAKQQAIAEHLMYEIAARGDVRAKLYGMIVRVRVIPDRTKRIPRVGFSRKDLINARKVRDNEPTRWRLEDIAERYGVHLGTVSDWIEDGAPIDLVKPNWDALDKWLKDRKDEVAELPALSDDDRDAKVGSKRSVNRLAQRYAEHIRTAAGEPSKAPFQLLRYRLKQAGVSIVRQKVRLVGERRPRDVVRELEFADHNEVRNLLGLPVHEQVDPDPGNAPPQETEPEPYVPSKPERRILAALERRALSTRALANAAKVDERLLYDRKRRGKIYPGYITRLRAAGKAAHHAQLGHYRPDAPPDALSG